MDETRTRLPEVVAKLFEVVAKHFLRTLTADDSNKIGTQLLCAITRIMCHFQKAWNSIPPEQVEFLAEQLESFATAIRDKRYVETIILNAADEAIDASTPTPQPSPHFFEGQNATGGWHFDAASLV